MGEGGRSIFCDIKVSKWLLHLKQNRGNIWDTFGTLYTIFRKMSTLKKKVYLFACHFRLFSTFPLNSFWLSYFFTITLPQHCKLLLLHVWSISRVLINLNTLSFRFWKKSFYAFTSENYQSVRFILSITKKQYHKLWGWLFTPQKVKKTKKNKT